MKQKYRVYVPVLAEETCTNRYEIEYEVEAESPEIALDLALAATLPGAPEFDSVHILEHHCIKDLDAQGAEFVAICDAQAVVQHDGGMTLLEKLLEYQPFPALPDPDLAVLIQYVEHYGERLGENDASGGNDEEHQIRGDFEMDLLAWLDRKFGLGLEVKFGDAWERGYSKGESEDAIESSNESN